MWFPLPCSPLYLFLKAKSMGSYCGGFFGTKSQLTYYDPCRCQIYRSEDRTSSPRSVIWPTSNWEESQGAAWRRGIVLPANGDSLDFRGSSPTPVSWPVGEALFLSPVRFKSCRRGSRGPPAGRHSCEMQAV